jgi:hypothetical protein
MDENAKMTAAQITTGSQSRARVATAMAMV